MSIRFDTRNQRWRFEYDRVVQGKRHRLSQLLQKGWTRAQATAFDLRETNRLHALATGIAKPQHLIDDAVLLYLQERVPQLKSRRNIEAELNACLHAYTGRDLSELPAVALEYARDQTGVIAPATIKNRLAYLRAATRYAWKYHNMGEHDPAERLVMPRVNNARHLYLDRAQFLRICRRVRLREARAAIRVAFYSGMRAAEVQTAALGLEGMVFDLGLTKNGEPRLIPVHPKVAHVTRNKDLWPTKVTRWTVSKEFKAAARLAGFPGARLHDMRHSAASAMINAGVDLFTVGGVLGHKSPVSTKRYSHLATATLAAAVGLIGRKPRTLAPASDAAADGKKPRTKPVKKIAKKQVKKAA
jgi:integrase